ncbi:MAG: DUF362 domain-containing protein [Lentisphaerae bacterium]|nr:MAG: DUF362 domain-containing protein [Lentisphaerota bacterium]
MGIYILQYDRYHALGLRRILEQLFCQQAALHSLLLDAKEILLKPNFVVPEHHERWSTTHPVFYLTVAEILREWGKNVTIGESPAFGSTRQALARHNALQRCHELGVRFLTFRKTKTIPGIPGHPHFHKLTVAAELDDFDAVINLPKLKVHCQTVFTGATKNLYGCVPGKRKAYRHFVSGNDLSAFMKMIHMTAAHVAPVFNIADGIVMMHRKGPRGGEPFALNRIIASESYLQLDWLFAAMIGLDPASQPLFRALPDTQVEQMRNELAAYTSDHPDFPSLTGFCHATPIDIEFSVPQMLRSLWRSLRQKFSLSSS